LFCKSKQALAESKHVSSVRLIIRKGRILYRAVRYLKLSEPSIIALYYTVKLGSCCFRLYHEGEDAIRLLLFCRSLLIQSLLAEREH